MALNIRDIKRRQKSIGNIGQIARAMELVSVTKMRRSQRAALSSRPYTKKALEILRNISKKVSADHSRFLEKKESEKTAVLLITTDKGLCGGLNTNIFRKTEKLIDGTTSTDSDFIVIGKKGEEWCRRKNLNVIKSFNNFGDFVDILETVPVSEFIINIFGNYGKIFAVYTNFITALKQEAASRFILPLTEKSLQEIIDSVVPEAGKFSELKDMDSDLDYGCRTSVAQYDFEYKFEPRVEEILDGILYSLIEAEIYYIILEHNASEHSARRMAMRNAYENADEMLNNLNLTYNKARQAGITQEISEIASAANIGN